MLNAQPYLGIFGSSILGETYRVISLGSDWSSPADFRQCLPFARSTTPPAGNLSSGALEQHRGQQRPASACTARFSVSRLDPYPCSWRLGIPACPALDQSLSGSSCHSLNCSTPLFIPTVLYTEPSIRRKDSKARKFVTLPTIETSMTHRSVGKSMSHSDFRGTEGYIASVNSRKR